MSIRALHRGVLWFGLSGTAVFVLFGFWTLVSRVWAASFTQTLEVLVVGPFLGGWVLSPLLWAARPRRESQSPEGEAVISFLAVALVVGLAVYAYVPEFVVLPVFFDVQPSLESLTLVLVIPAAQWVILGMAGAMRWARSR